LDEVFNGNATVSEIPSSLKGELHFVELKYDLNHIPIKLIVHALNVVDDLELDYGRLDYKSDEWLSIKSKLTNK
jgi:hypothetical protein